MKKVQLDFAEFTIADQLILAKHNIYIKLIEEDGPGGGASIYELVGTEENLKAYINEVEADGGDPEYLISLIEDANL